MKVDIDISPQIKSGEDIYLGMGGAKYDCICIRAGEMSLLFKLVVQEEQKRSRGKSKGRNKARQKVRIYTIMCFLLAEPHLNKLTHLDIDQDFKGHHGAVSDKLISLIIESGFDPDRMYINAKAKAGKGEAHNMANYARTGDMGKKVSKHGAEKIRSVSIRYIMAEEIFNHYR
jgi:hypothetical protein